MRGRVASGGALPVADNAVVIMGRPRAAGPSPVQEIAVVVGRFAPLEEFEKGVRAAAAKGFRMCGFTIAGPVWGRASVYTPVAVMTRNLAAPNETMDYRVIQTLGRRSEWAILEKGRRRASPSRIWFSSRTAPGGVSEVLFIAEKGPAAQPLLYESGVCREMRFRCRRTSTSQWRRGTGFKRFGPGGSRRSG